MVDVSADEDLMAAQQALAAAFYALHDSLVESGAIEPGVVAATLRRVTAPNEKYLAYVEGIARNLEARLFRTVTLRESLRVIDGGADEEE